MEIYETYTLSLHDALPISREEAGHEGLDAVHDAPEVDVHGVLPVGVRRDGDLTHRGDAGVVADDVHGAEAPFGCVGERADRKSTRLNSSHPSISYAVFCLK